MNEGIEKVVSDKENNECKEVNLKLNEAPENYSESCVIVENGIEVVTIVTQENDNHIYIYNKNEENVQNASEFVEVSDSNSVLESSADSQESITIDVIGEENVKNDENVVYVEKLKDADVSQQDSLVKDKINTVDDDKVKNGLIEKNSEENINLNEKNLLEGKEKKEEIETKKNEEIETKKNEEVETKKNEEIENCSNEIVIEELQVVREDLTNEPSQVNHTDSNNEIIEKSDAEKNCCIIVENESNNDSVVHNQSQEGNTIVIEGEIVNLMSDTKVDSLKYSKSISKDDIVKILDESTERVVKPIVAGKDLFFSIELTKRLNQKLAQNKSLKNSESIEKTTVNENEVSDNNNTVDDRQKIVDILEADEIKDWKTCPSKSDLNPKENGNDMEISKAIKSMEAGNTSLKEQPSKPVKKTQVKKFKIMDKELERSIALQQLREEFPTTRKRIRTTKKVNHIPFLASTVVEKALTSPEVSTALKPETPKRRPCYLPDNKSDVKVGNHVENKIIEDKEATPSTSNKIVTNKKSNDVIFVETKTSPSISTNVVKTYSVKRKSTDADNNIKSTLETIAAVTKALNQNEEEENESKPKKQKTVVKVENKTPKKVYKKKGITKPGSGKRNLELEKLLGDEGAVRMLYETQHKDSGLGSAKKSKTKTTTGLKKDLVLKTKLVKNAVMRLSGMGTEGVYLRGKRLSREPKLDISNSEPLFASTPNIILYKPKKKQRAEASRILYRHSSSESFDSSEGYRRTSFDADGLNVPNKEESMTNEEKLKNVNFEERKSSEKSLPPKSFSKKSESFIKKNSLKRIKRVGRKKRIKIKKVKKELENGSNGDTVMPPSTSKLNLSNVPIRKSCRPRTVSKKYSIWSSTSMDSLSVESLGLKKIKKASPELGKKLNCKEWTILQYDYLVQIILNPTSTTLKNSFNFQV